MGRKTVGKAAECLFLAALGVVTGAQRLRAGSVSWAVDADGQFTTGSNWSTGMAPGITDDVIISRPAGNFNISLSGSTSINSLISNENFTIPGSQGILTIAGPSSFNGALTLTSGAVNGNGDLTINGPFAFAGLLGGSGIVTLGVTSVTTVTGAAVTPTLQRTLNNYGTFNFNNAGNLEVDAATVNNFGTFAIVASSGFGATGGASTFNNQAGGVFNLNVSSLFNCPLTFNNSGTVNLLTGQLNATTGGANTGTVNVNPGATFSASQGYLNSGTFNFNTSATLNHFLNNGVISANAGTLTMNSGSGTGTFAIAPGASVSLPIGYTAQAGTLISGAGSLTLSGQTLFAGNINMTGSVTLSGATFAGSQTFNGAVTVNSGITLAGAGDVTIGGPLSWVGTMAGTGKTTLLPTSVTNVGASADLSRNMDHSGLMIFGSQSILTVANSTLRNLAGGTIDATQGGILSISNANFINSGTMLIGPTFGFTQSASNNLITNNGTMIVQGSAGVIPVPFANTGLFEEPDGLTATLVSGGMNSGTIVFGTTMGVSFGGTYANTGTINFGNGGTIRNLSGSAGTINVLNANLTATTVTLNSGTISVGGKSNLVLSTGDSFGGTVSITGAGGVSVASGNNVVFGGAINVTGPISLAGTTTFTAPQTFLGAVNLPNATTLTGPADINIAGPFTFAGTMAGAGKTNLLAGSTASISTGAPATLSRTLNNLGTINYASSQPFNFSGGTFNNSGVFSIEQTVGSNTFSGIITDSFNNLAVGTVNFVCGTSLAPTTFVSSVAFNNAGTMNLFVGMLNLAGGGTNTGTINVFSGATPTLASSYANAGAINFTEANSFASSINGSGQINVLAGVLTFAGSNASYSGSLFVDAGAGAMFSVPTSANSLSIVGDGSITFSGSPNSTFSGSFSSTGNVTVAAGANLTINSDQNFVCAVTDSGTITGPGGFTFSGLLTLNGAMAGTGTTKLAAGATASFAGPGGGLSRRFDNFGVINLSGGFAINDSPSLNGVPALTNDAGSVINASGSINSTLVTTVQNLDGAKVNLNAGGTTFSSADTLNNAGTLNATGGGTCFMSGGFVNSGVVNIAAGTTVNVQHPAGLAMATPFTWTGGSINAAGPLIVDNAGATFSGSVAKTGGALLLVAGAFAETGVLDLTNSVFAVDCGAPSATSVMIRNLLASGYHGGAWDGQGIVSSTARNNPRFGIGYVIAGDIGYSTFAGTAVSSNAVLLGYTVFGDSTLDGKVDLGNDFNLFLAGYLSGASSWELGDYNYDGKVDATDFGLFIDGYKGRSGAMGDLTAVIDAAPLSIAQKAQLLSVVPEPSILPILVFPYFLSKRRRK